MISAFNSIYDVLDVGSPVMIPGKLIYRQTCLKKLRWGERLLQETGKKWKQWIGYQPKQCQGVQLEKLRDAVHTHSLMLADLQYVQWSTWSTHALNQVAIWLQVNQELFQRVCQYYVWNWLL